MGEKLRGILRVETSAAMAGLVLLRQVGRWIELTKSLAK
jgi:hypothetical protein